MIANFFFNKNKGIKNKNICNKAKIFAKEQ